jgi:hypothetical protein
MNDDRDALRYAARRASLRAALRDGDAVTAARAASRLRVDGFALSTDEFARARKVRHAIGLALVKARMPKPAEAPLRHEPAIYSLDRGPRKRLAAALAIIAGLLLALLFGGEVVPPGGGGGAPPVSIESTHAPIVTVSRGRTISLPAEIVVVEESPTPAPTVEPTAEPIASAAPGTARPSAPTGSGSGSTGSGTGQGGGDGTGNGTGSGPGTGSGSATPGPTPTLPPLRPGFSRLNFIVYDATSRTRTVADVCIVAGAPNCGPNAPHTDAYGRASIDVAATSASTQWDIIFIKSGYVTQTKSITLPGGQIRTFVIYLVRSRG